MGRWAVVGAWCMAVAGVLAGLGIALGHGAPPPVRAAQLSLSQARQQAQQAVKASQVIISAPSAHGGHAGYVFALRRPTGQLVWAWVPLQGGRVVTGPTVKPLNTAAAAMARRPSQPKSPLTALAASSVALRAAGGGQLLWVRPVEAKGHLAQNYVAEILMPDSSRVKVQVEADGKVAWIHPVRDG